MSDEAGVRAASDKFYAALTSMCRGDAAPMAEVWWAEDGAASTMHPIGGRDIGVDAVLGSFGNVAGISTAGHVAISDQIIRVNGDTAWELSLIHI